MFDILAQSSLGVGRFDIEDTGTGARIVARASQYQFEATVGWSDRGDYFVVQYSPGAQVLTDSMSGDDWGAIVEAGLQRWLANLERELSAPDPWAELAARREIDSASRAPGYDNSPFTDAERATLAQGLDELCAFILARAELEGEKRIVLEQNISYLKDAADRTGRTDWRGIFQSVMFTLIAEAIAPPDVVRQGMVIALRSAAHLFGIHVPDPLDAGPGLIA